MTIDWKELDIKGIATVISEHLRQQGIDVTLVGGACVAIYSKNEYLSYDLDYVTDTTLKELVQAMSPLGFKRKSGRLFAHEECQFIIDFVFPPLAIGQEMVKTVGEEKSQYGTLRLLTPTDCVRDRLSGYYSWNDPQAFEQAIIVAKTQKDKIDTKEIEIWSEKEKNMEKYMIFLQKLEEQSNNF